MIVGIDHGYYAIKTKHVSFPSGIIKYDYEPYTMQNVLQYRGKYYVCGTGRQTLVKNKTSNDNYYLLTLAAIAEEIKHRKAERKTEVILAVGLPLSSFGREKQGFREYLLRKEQPVRFLYESEWYEIQIKDVKLFPQGYSALALHPEYLKNEPSVLLVDIGGWTVDLMRLDNAVPNAATCRSLELGVIRCIDETAEQVRRNTGLSVTETQIERVLRGETCSMAESIAVKQYAIYKQAAGKTAKSILISVGVRLAAFNLKQIANLTCTDELDLYSIGEKKVALFCCIPDADTSMNYLVGMIYSNLFQTLYYVADRKYGGRLPIPVHCIMDEWPNVALPDDFDKILATMRSRGISCSIIIQNIAQMKALFKDSYESLIGNCDEFLYLGGNEKEGHKYVSELLGKETLDTNTYGQTKGRSGSYSVNYQQTGRELLTPDEIRLLDNRKAILFIRGERPIMDDKYDLKKHVNFRYTEDGGASPYDYAKTPLAHDDLKIDINRLDDYELLSTEDILGE